jgi:hypothetical protein
VAETELKVGIVEAKLKTPKNNLSEYATVTMMLKLNT